MPARDGGDYGLDGFSQDGVAYQAYAPLEPLSVAQLYQKQRDKITSDTKKIIQYCDSIKKIFGNVLIERWTLVTPRYDSADLLAHATYRASVIKNASLPFVSPDFYITIETQDDFPTERDLLLQQGRLQVQFDLDGIDEPIEEPWLSKNSQLINNGRAKLDKVSSISNASKEDALEKFIKSYIFGGNALSSLYQTYPDAWERVNKINRQHVANVKMKPSLGSVDAEQKLDTTLKQLQQWYQEEVKALPEEVAHTFALGTVAEWLFSCPLEF